MIRSLLFAACLLAVSACACPVPEQSYHRTPYNDEQRTAGHGYVDDGCLRMSLPGY
jgi:hypothetical protein